MLAFERAGKPTTIVGLGLSSRGLSSHKFKFDQRSASVKKLDIASVFPPGCLPVFAV